MYYIPTIDPRLLHSAPPEVPRGIPLCVLQAHLGHGTPQAPRLLGLSHILRLVVPPTRQCAPPRIVNDIAYASFWPRRAAVECRAVGLDGLRRSICRVRCTHNGGTLTGAHVRPNVYAAADINPRASRQTGPMCAKCACAPAEDVGIHTRLTAPGGRHRL